MTEKLRLEVLDSFVALSSIESINFFVFTEFIRLQFYGVTETQRGTTFRFNPVNTLLYRMIEAKANQDLVNVIECIRNEESMFSKLKTKIQGKWNLVLHRNIISHPSTTVWTDPQTQIFYDNHQHYFLSKASEIWKVKRSLEKGLNKFNGNSQNPIRVHCMVEFVDFFISIMTLSLQTHVTLPPRATIQANLDTFFLDYDTNLRTQF